MANSLNRNLKMGDKVVLSDHQTYEVAAETFGNMSFTSGSALMVKRYGDPEVIRASGYDIDPKATLEKHSADNGWDKEVK